MARGVCLRLGRTVRSVPRDARVERGQPRWIPGDVDGDGHAFAIRVQDRGGELVEAREFPGLLVERTLEDEGPFYRLYPEVMTRTTAISAATACVRKEARLQRAPLCDL